MPENHQGCQKTTRDVSTATRDVSTATRDVSTASVESQWCRYSLSGVTVVPVQPKNRYFRRITAKKPVFPENYSQNQEISVIYSQNQEISVIYSQNREMTGFSAQNREMTGFQPKTGNSRLFQPKSGNSRLFQPKSGNFSLKVGFLASTVGILASTVGILATVVYFWPQLVYFWPQLVYFWPQRVYFWPNWSKTGVFLAKLVQNWCISVFLAQTGGFLARAVVIWSRAVVIWSSGSGYLVPGLFCRVSLRTGAPGPVPRTTTRVRTVPVHHHPRVPHRGLPATPHHRCHPLSGRGRFARLLLDCTDQNCSKSGTAKNHCPVVKTTARWWNPARW